MRERHVLRAWPLTPIHIGTGEELTPESFVLEGDRLRGFNPFAALAIASEPERERYRQWLKSGDFVRAQTELAKLASSRSAFSGESIAVSPLTRRDLENVLDGRSPGKGGIRPFLRDGGSPILPGSSLKGALRTAWIDQEIDGEATEAQIPIDTRGTSKQARVVTETALHIEKPSALEQDPFRDVAAVDARIPASRTRYDRATLGKLVKDGAKLDFTGTGGIQMHVERLLSLADGGAVAPFEVEIDVAPDAHIEARARTARRGQRIVPARPIGATALWKAANRFHADLWLYERKRFYHDSPTAPLLDSLLQAFGLNKDDKLAEQLDAKGLVLLRVGRYGQFESKAVRLNGRRHGVKAATSSKISGSKLARFMDEGGTRTTVAVANDIAAPFGWLLLALPGNGTVSVNLGTSATASGRGAASGRPSAAPLVIRPTLVGNLIFSKGEWVVNDELGDEGKVLRDVTTADKTMDVDFDGEIDRVSVTGWRRK
jgi:CRISPR-associated protein Csm5